MKNWNREACTYLNDAAARPGIVVEDRHRVAVARDLDLILARQHVVLQEEASHGDDDGGGGGDGDGETKARQEHSPTRALSCSVSYRSPGSISVDFRQGQHKVRDVRSRGILGESELELKVVRQVGCV